MKRKIDCKNTAVPKPLLNSSLSSASSIKKVPLHFLDGDEWGREYFSHMKTHMIPKPFLEKNRAHPLVSALYVTDIGYYPCASNHYRKRPNGCDEYILKICTEGQGWIEYNEGPRVDIQANQAFFIPRKEAHAYGASKEKPWTVYWVHFCGSDVDHFFSLLPVRIPVIPLSLRCTKECLHLSRQMLRASSTCDTTSSMLYNSSLLRLLLSTLFFSNAKYSPHTRAPTRHDLQSTIDYCAAHFSDPLTIEELVQQSRLSERTFMRLFSQQTGLTPMQYICQQRLKHACQLLSKTSLTIAEIAYTSGFQDPYYFSRVFRKAYSISPKQWRQEYMTSWLN